MALVALLWWLIAGTSATRRYVVAVDLVIAGEANTLRGVWEATTREASIKLPFGIQTTDETHGQALFIEVDDHTAVFVLMRGRGGFPYAGYGNFLRDCAYRSLDEFRSYEGTCTTNRRPEILVARGDLHGSEVPELFIGAEGSGIDVTMNGVSATTTSDWVAGGIEQKFPWIGRLKRYGMTSQADPDQSIAKEFVYKLDLAR